MGLLGSFNVVTTSGQNVHDGETGHEAIGGKMETILLLALLAGLLFLKVKYGVG